MIRNALCLLALLLFFLHGIPQVNITASDMPEADDTFRYSNANTFTPVAYAENGANETWDFTNLTETGQYVDTFLSILQTPFQYQAVFNQPFDPDRATLAKRENNITLGPVDVNEVYYYYTEKNARFEVKGFGGRINGVPTPVEYNNPDVLYEFPLSYQDQYTSSTSFSIRVPDYAYIGREITRDCEVTGWGQLILPMDTFETIKLRCEVDKKDTIYLQDVGQGTTFDQPTEVHYKWVTEKEGVPALQINTTEIVAGSEIVNEVFYRDTLTQPDTPKDTTDQPDTTGIARTEKVPKSAFRVVPNPVRDNHIQIDYQLKRPSSVHISIFNMDGRKIVEKHLANQKTGNHQHRISFDEIDVSASTYLLRFDTPQITCHKKIVVID